MIPPILVHASSFRIFRGFKKPDLAEDAFLKDLGQTFMPGTPLMLRELGLAAYLPTVLPKVAEAPDLPDEVAIIAYPSREQYAWVRNQTVLGRMYTYTHLAVFDMATSRSAFPEPLGTSQELIRPFYCTGEAGDWQGDVDVVFWAGRRGDGVDGASFADGFTAELGAVLPELRNAGVLECVGQVAAGWSAFWLLFRGRLGAAVPPEIEELITQGLPSAPAIMMQLVTRHVWRDQLPAPTVTRPSSFSFIFTRDARFFLR